MFVGRLAVTRKGKRQSDPDGERGETARNCWEGRRVSHGHVTSTNRFMVPDELGTAGGRAWRSVLVMA